MGIPQFWNLVSSHGHLDETREGLVGQLKGKVLAVDLSFWVCSDNGALGGNLGGGVVRYPHLRNLFFRTIKLITLVGAFPVFVLDGEAPAEKWQAQLQRSSRTNGTPLTKVQARAAAAGGRRGSSGGEHAQIADCKVLLDLMGLPMVQARAEAEALCAELNACGYVDGCVTPDSDVLLYGAHTVIKQLAVDFKKPLIEWYEASELEKALGLKRRHMVALGLLMGSDYDDTGVAMIGGKQALRLVQSCSEEQVLDRLRAWGRGEKPSPAEMNLFSSSEEISATSPGKKPVHCSVCGHPGGKRVHGKEGCKECRTEGQEQCKEKAKGFRCECEWCIAARKAQVAQRDRSWWERICQRMAGVPGGFPNERLIQIYLDPHSHMADNQLPVDKLLLWRPPDLARLCPWLTARLETTDARWRAKTLPLASAHCFARLLKAKESVSDGWGRVASLAVGVDGRDGLGLLDGLYSPARISKTRTFYNLSLFIVHWRLLNAPEPSGEEETTGGKTGVVVWGTTAEISTDSERAELVEAACPELVKAYQQEQEAKAAAKKQKKRKRTSTEAQQIPHRPISSFLKTTKVARTESIKPPSHKSRPATETPVQEHRQPATASLAVQKQAVTTPTVGNQGSGTPELGPSSRMSRDAGKCTTEQSFLEESGARGQKRCARELFPSAPAESNQDKVDKGKRRRLEEGPRQEKLTRFFQPKTSAQASPLGDDGRSESIEACREMRLESSCQAGTSGKATAQTAVRAASLSERRLFEPCSLRDSNNSGSEDISRASGRQAGMDYGWSLGWSTEATTNTAAPLKVLQKALHKTSVEVEGDLAWQPGHLVQQEKKPEKSQRRKWGGLPAGVEVVGCEAASVKDLKKVAGCREVILLD